MSAWARTGSRFLCLLTVTWQQVQVCMIGLATVVRGRGARVRNALEVSQHVASSRAGADAVFRCKFILSLVRGGGGLEGRRILQRSLVPGLCRRRFLSLGGVTRRRAFDTY